MSDRTVQDAADLLSDMNLITSIGIAKISNALQIPDIKLTK